ncbi:MULTISPECIES: hypothetical protein [Synergistales]|nr:hypothetical protein [Aminithiophilus ramosus]
MEGGTTWIVNMVLILGITFGGFAWCIWKTMQGQERRAREQKRD